MFDVTTLNAYVDEQKAGLIAKAVLGGKTLDVVNIMDGVKYSVSLNLLGIQAPLQGGACGFNASGDDKISQRILTAPTVKVQKKWCEEALRQYFANYQLRHAAGKETLPFENVLCDEIVKAVEAAVEKAVWQGDATTGVKGFLDYTAEFTSAGTAIAGAKAAIEAAYMAIPASILGNAAIFVGEDVYREYTQALVAANMYHYDGKYNNGEIYIPGTNVRVIAVNGLNGQKTVIAADPKNLVAGTDVLGDMSEFKLWYSDDNQEFRFSLKFNLGTQVAFPDEVVIATLA